MLIPEAFLEHVELVAISEAFDGRYGGTVGLRCERCTRLN